MTYFVNLVQRGISANQHPVSGKSGKGYGTAVASPQHGGVIFRMSLQDYMNAAHDLCGNTIAGQQWVPEFVMEAGAQAQARPKCDRCPKPSVAIWDRFPYCADHAPANATWYDENERATAAPATPANAPDVLPVVVEPPMTPGVTDKKAQQDLPREQLAPSFVGSAEETAGAATGPKPPVVMPEPAATGPAASRPLDIPPAGFIAQTGPITETGPTGVSGAAQPPPAAASEQVEPVAHPPGDKPDSIKVVQAITEGVIKAVVPQLEKMIDQRLNKAPAKPAPTSTPKKKKGPGGFRPPNPEWKALQQKAKDLGIPIFGKSKQALQDAIAEKEAPLKPE